MAYFIIWVVFLLACIVALPVAAMMDKRRVAGNRPTVEDAAFGSDDSLAGFDQEEPAAEDSGFGGDEAFPVEEMADVGGGDDFSAFDEEFK